jgi:hypothetical protein
MHFHLPSFLLGIFLGIALVLVLVCLFVKYSSKDEGRIWRRLSQLDGLSDENKTQG